MPLAARRSEAPLLLKERNCLCSVARNESSQTMLTQVKRASLRTLKSAGVFDRVRESKWRRERLLILCYHCTSIADEHQWRPGLFMSPQQLEQRLDMLASGPYHVLPLHEALQRLRSKDLPRASVVLTFDDGTADFYSQVYPMLKNRGLPATVYQTTYHSDFQKPIFNLVCSYMLWKCGGKILQAGHELGLSEPMDLRTEASRHEIVVKLVARTTQQNLTGREKNEVAIHLANILGLDYASLVSKRVLQLMTPNEVSELAKAGIDFQLHTHRHRTPNDATLFKKEIRDNRTRLQEITGKAANHFCYPSGVHNPDFLPWLREEEVLSATTCDIRLATAQDEALLLPRFVDTTGRSNIEYESWLSGVGHLLSRKKAATQKYLPAES
jgi:peptidoglycan/xylan/chitin deacetylase (PgdA/CDA1 family)